MRRRHNASLKVWTAVEGSAKNPVEKGIWFRHNKEVKIRCLYQVHLLNWFGVQAITLYPLILFANSREEVSETLYRHELEHVYQVERLGWLRFYLTYLKHYFAFRKKGMSHQVAYLSNPFEIEARESEKLKLTHVEARLLGREQS